MRATHISVVGLAGLLLIHGISVPAQEAQETITPAPGAEGTIAKRFGVGLMLGEPTGASFKYWVSEKSAIDGLVGWSFANHEDFTVQADYLYHLFNVVDVSPGRFPIYFGGGLRYKAQDRRDDIFGIRTVAGVSYMFDDVPVDVFFEAGPVFDVTPDFEVNYTVGMGARYWF